MKYMLVRHKVADFDSWKRVFDSHAEAQRNAGLDVDKVLRNTDDPGEVFLLFAVTDPVRALEFVTSSDVPDAQEQSGVVDEPDIYFLE